MFLRTWRLRDGDRVHADGALSRERLYVRVTRWRVVLAATGAAAYALGLLVFLPAEAAVGAAARPVGTVWRGEMRLEPGFATAWSVRPLASLAGLTGAADVRVTGPATALDARVEGRSADTLVVNEMRGAGSLRLVSALAPNAPISCDGQAVVSGRGLGGGRVGSGTVRTGPAECRVPGAGVAGAAARTPPLDARIASDPDGMGVVVSGPTGAALARARAPASGAVTLEITAEGATAVPGLPAGEITFGP